VSELYVRNVEQASVDMTGPQAIFSKSKLRRFRSYAANLNWEGRGDQAAFDFVRIMIGSYVFSLCSDCPTMQSQSRREE